MCVADYNSVFQFNLGQPIGPSVENKTGQTKKQSFSQRAKAAKTYEDFAKLSLEVADRWENPKFDNRLVDAALKQFKTFDQLRHLFGQEASPSFKNRLLRKSLEQLKLSDLRMIIWFATHIVEPRFDGEGLRTELVRQSVPLCMPVGEAGQQKIFNILLYMSVMRVGPEFVDEIVQYNQEHIFREFASDPRYFEGLITALQVTTSRIYVRVFEIMIKRLDLASHDGFDLQIMLKMAGRVYLHEPQVLGPLVISLIEQISLRITETTSTEEVIGIVTCITQAMMEQIPEVRSFCDKTLYPAVINMIAREGLNTLFPCGQMAGCDEVAHKLVKLVWGAQYEEIDSLEKIWLLRDCIRSNHHNGGHLKYELVSFAQSKGLLHAPSEVDSFMEGRHAPNGETLPQNPNPVAMTNLNQLMSAMYK